MFVKCGQHLTDILIHEQVIFCNVDVQYKNMHLWKENEKNKEESKKITPKN